jgi:gamma-glutamylputrescine oxidase
MQLGNGASGRNGGLVLNGITVKDVDPDLVAKEHAVTCGAIDAIEAIIKEHSLNVRFRRDGCLHVSTTREAADAAQAMTEQLVARGLPLKFLTGDALPLKLRGAHGAVLDPTEGLLVGVDLIRGLRPVLVARGVQIYEGTRVTRIREGATIEIETAGGTVHAHAVVIATSGYSPRLGYFSTGLLPVISHVIATEPLPAKLRAELGFDNVVGFFDDSPRLAYCSIDPAGRVVFGGGTTAAYAYQFGNATAYRAERNDSAERALRTMLTNYIPELADVPIAHRWSGPLDLTLVRHCAVGVMGDEKNVFYGVGYSGHGITLANLAGRVIADLYAGNHEPWRDKAFYMRRPAGIPPEPFRWLGYHAYTKLTGKSPWKKPE